VTATMNEMWSPVVKTSVTTAVGFLSFALSPIRPVQMFGLFTAVGVIYCMLFSLTVVPAVLAMTGSSGPLKKSHRPSPPVPSPLVGDVERRSALSTRGDATVLQRADRSAVHDPRPESDEMIAAAGTRHARWPGVVRRGRFIIVALAMGLVVATPFGVRRIQIQDSWINGFAPSSDFHRATQWFNEQFLGVHTLLIRVGIEPSEPVRGHITGSVIDHHGVRLPLPADIDPASLVGRAITLHRITVPDASAPSALPRRYRDEWDTWIEAAQRVDDHVVITVHPKHGSPKMGLSPQPAETFEYAILPRWLMQPAVLHRIAEFKTFLESRSAETVGGVLAPSDYLATTEFLIRGRKPGSREIPKDRDRVKWDWLQYGSVRGQERLRQAVNADYSAGLISVYMKNANFIDTKRLMEAIRDYERTDLAPHGMHLSFAGDVAVSQSLIGAIVRTQIISLLGSLIGILAITAVMGRSLGWGALCVLPCALALLINFAVMGWTGMPLGVATSMFSGMTLGIGVDFAIHLLERYRKLRAGGLDSATALNDAMTVVGPAIVIDGLGVAVGFGVLMLSQVPANARLGGLVVLSIVNCLVVTLLLVPAILSLGRRRT